MYHVSFHCFYPDGGRSDHVQFLELDDIGEWMRCYKFCYPNCTAISCKIWFSEED